MQPNRRRIPYALLLFTGFARINLTADKTGSSKACHMPARPEGFVAPDFSLKMLSDRRFNLCQLRGQPVLVNIWATWCPPCRAEMPALQKYYEL